MTPWKDVKAFGVLGAHMEEVEAVKKIWSERNEKCNMDIETTTV